MISLTSTSSLPPRALSALSTLASSFLSGSKLSHFESLQTASTLLNRSIPPTSCTITKKKPSSPTSSSIRLLLIRHGEAHHNVFANNFTGEGEASFHPDAPIDPFLTDLGVEQAKALVPTTKALEHQPSLILVSPLKRATQTGLTAFPSSQYNFQCNHLLTEGSNGVREDMISDGESLSNIFNEVDYTAYKRDCDITSEHEIVPESDLVWSKKKLLSRSDEFLRYVYSLREDHSVIGVATHSQWLQSFCNFSLNFEDPRECLEWFGTGELRSVDVEFKD